MMGRECGYAIIYIKKEWKPAKCITAFKDTFVYTVNYKNALIVLCESLEEIPKYEWIERIEPWFIKDV